MADKPKFLKEYGGITQEQLTRHCLNQLTNLPAYRSNNTQSGTFNLLQPGERCFIVNLRYQHTKFDNGTRVMPYFVHCPNPEEAVEKLALPSFAAWQGHRDELGWPKLYTGLPLEVTTISLKTYMDLWRVASKFGALYSGPEVCPHVFVGAKHDEAGNFIMLSSEFYGATKLL